jgi:protein involved in ribonucleotide reduction
MPVMNDQALKAAVGRFLKNVNFTAQREIEKVVRSAVASGKLQDGENFTAAVTLSSEKLDLNVTIFSKIELQ